MYYTTKALMDCLLKEKRTNVLGPVLPSCHIVMCSTQVDSQRSMHNKHHLIHETVLMYISLVYGVICPYPNLASITETRHI